MSNLPKNIFGLRPESPLRKIIFLTGLIISMTPWCSPPVALLAGLVIAVTTGHPFPKYNRKAINFLLQFSVVGLGFGMNIFAALQTGKEGFILTVFSIVITLTTGILLGKWLKVDKVSSLLISGGTAICGGSAIAALSPVVAAKEKQITVALGTVFILNSVALLLFPWIGHLLGLSQSQFGLWCAIAIHDTSSVVGAASRYGIESLKIATTVKLARALWIIPVSIAAALIYKGGNTKIKIPYFIGLFVVAMLLNTYVPSIRSISDTIVLVARTGLTMTLFLIGTSLSKTVLKSVGLSAMLQGIILWIFVSTTALWIIMTLT